LFNRFTKSRRGVSPVIASIILIGAAIATGLVVVSWANNNFINQQTEAGVFFAGRSAAIEESFVIEDVWFYVDGDKYVNVTVRNVGVANITIEAVYFNGTDRLDESQSVVVGTAETLTITWTPGWESGSYYIVVASARGNQVREYYSTSG